MPIHNDWNQCGRFTDIPPRSDLTLTVNIRWSQRGEQRLRYVKCQYKVLNFKPRLRLAHANNLSPRLCGLTLSVTEIALTLISGNVKCALRATKRATRQPSACCGRNELRLRCAIFRNAISARKGNRAFRKNYVADRILRRRADLQPLSFTKASASRRGIYNGAPRFKIHVDGLKGISAFCRNQSDCK